MNLEQLKKIADIAMLEGDKIVIKSNFIDNNVAFVLSRMTVQMYKDIYFDDVIIIAYFAHRCKNSVNTK